MSGGLAVDLGTSRTRLVDAAGRIIFDDATAAAIDLRSGSLLAYGESALDMPGRTAGHVGLARPVVHGQLQDLALTDEVVEFLMGRARRKIGRHPDLCITVPGLASNVQRRALERAFKHAGADHVEFVAHATAAGIGLRLSIEEPVATMVVDAGGGTTDVVVMALGGVVTEGSVPVGGEDLDAAVRELCLRSFDLVVSPAVAERVKISIGHARVPEETKMQVVGRDASNGTERRISLSSSEVAAALDHRLSAMLDAAVRCIVAAPPDLADDLIAEGLHLAGGASLLAGFCERLASATGIPVHAATTPRRAAVLGAARCLEERLRRRREDAVTD